jgi:hypothetical protein
MPAVVSADGTRIGSWVTGHGPTLLYIAGGEARPATRRGRRALLGPDHAQLRIINSTRPRSRPTSQHSSNRQVANAGCVELRRRG